jgi:Kef-type K+ transport system membrane component KefB
VIVFLGVATVAYLFLPRTELFASLPHIPVAATALVVGLIGVANSPATTVALINEYHARGPYTDTVLGVTVFKDVSVLVLVALSLPFVQLLSLPGESLDLHFVGELAWSIGGSLVGGVVLGLLVTLYMRGVRVVLPIFIVAVSIVVSQVARELHLEALLLCMVAGFVIENATEYGDRFIQGIERSSLPVYVVFFAIGGASLDLGALQTAWAATLLLAVSRIALTWGATWTGETLSKGGDENVKRLGWLGFVAQAGVTLGIAAIISRTFPEWGPAVKTIALALIAFNQLIGPIGLRFALLKSGEARSRPVA